MEQKPTTSPRPAQPATPRTPGANKPTNPLFFVALAINLICIIFLSVLFVMGSTADTIASEDYDIAPDALDTLSISDDDFDSTTTEDYADDTDTYQPTDDEYAGEEMPDWEGHHVLTGIMKGGNMRLTLDINDGGYVSGTYRNLDCGTTMSVSGMIGGRYLEVEGVIKTTKFTFELTLEEDNVTFSGICRIVTGENRTSEKEVRLHLDE